MKFTEEDDTTFCGYVEGVLATTHVDSHRDKLSYEAIRGLYDSFVNNPQLRVFRLQHQMESRCSEMLEAHLCSTEDGEWEIRAKIGVYKDYPEVLEAMQSGILRGFSYAARLPEMGPPGQTPLFQLHIPGEHWHEVADILLANGASVTPVVKKGVDTLTILYVAGSAASIATLVASTCAFARHVLSRSGSPGAPQQNEKDVFFIQVGSITINLMSADPEVIAREIDKVRAEEEQEQEQ